MELPAFLKFNDFFCNCFWRASIGISGCNMVVYNFNWSFRCAFVICVLNEFLICVMYENVDSQRYVVAIAFVAFMLFGNIKFVYVP